jgi:hypothetical protein
MGVTVPGTFVNAFDTLVNSERGRQILANALIAAASAAAAALTKGPNREARQIAADAGNQVADDLSGAAAAVVGEIVSGAAQAFLPASLTGNNRKKPGRG